jgi:DNA-binding transcriptional LysR family regulator
MLFRERYVCVVRADHPNFGSGMSTEAFACSQRAIADASGMGHAVVEEELARQGFTTVPSLTVPQFMVMPLVIASSDLLVIMPSRLAEAFAQLISIKILKPPVTLPPYDIKIYWHERFDRDSANRWLREAFVRLFRK